LSSSLSHPSLAVDFGIFAFHITGLSSITGSLNFSVTILSYYHIHLYYHYLVILSIFVTSLLLITTLPVLAAAITVLLLDRQWNASNLDYLLGGDCVIFQHLFWFFGHPEVYIIIIPVFGIISHTMSLVCNRKSVFGYLAMGFAITSIAFVGFIVWAHHMYVVGLDLDTRCYFAIATIVIGIPTSVKVYSWLHSIAFSLLRSDGSTSYILGFISLFTVGGFTGIVLSNALLDVCLHDTYYVVGHFHYVLSLGAVYGVLLVSTLYFGYIFGSVRGEAIDKSLFLVILLGSNVLFFPMHFAGLNGMPRRIHDYADTYWFLNFCASLGLALVLFYLIF